jgi:Tfp pilus assembly protein PilV
MIRDNHQKGFSLVEALLASALLSIVVTTFTLAIIYGQESTVVAGGISRATLLAQEGLEATRNIRDESFSNLFDGSYGLAVSNNQWVFSGNSDTTDGFVRQISISTVDDNRKLITSTVTWQQTPQRAGNIVLTTYLNNWR